MANAGDETARRGQLISMTEWRVLDSSASEDRPPRRAQHAARRRAAREERQIIRAARQLAGTTRLGDSDDIIDCWQDALGGFDCA